MGKTVVVGLFLIVAYAPANVSAQATGSLVPEFELPRDWAPTYLAEPRRLAFCRGAFFVTDFGAKSLHKIGVGEVESLSFVSDGQGPGEFLWTVDVACDDSTVVATDPGNMRIHFFDPDLNHLSQFSALGMRASGIALDGNRLFIVDAGAGRDSLITVYDRSGQMVREFGRPLEATLPEHGLGNSAQVGVLRIYDGELYYLSLRYPVLRVYGLDGRLRRKFDFGAVEDYVERSKPNRDYKNLTGTSGTVAYRYLFRSLAITRRALYVGVYEKDKIFVDEWSHAGSFVQRYEDGSRQEDRAGYIWDMWAEDNLDSLNGETLWILMTRPRATIRAYSVSGF
jgi:hypothetical protein